MESNTGILRAQMRRAQNDADQEHRRPLNWMSESIGSDIDEAQTEEVINAIYSRFPDTGMLKPMGSSESHFISLNLNQPKDL